MPLTPIRNTIITGTLKSHLTAYCTVEFSPVPSLICARPLLISNNDVSGIRGYRLSKTDACVTVYACAIRKKKTFHITNIPFHYIPEKVTFSFLLY